MKLNALTCLMILVGNYYLSGTREEIVKYAVILDMIGG